MTFAPRFAPRLASEKLALSLDAADALADRLPRPRVFTNGVFDLLRRGHCDVLQAARALGGALIVGVNPDAFRAAPRQGPERPINAAADRAAVVAARECVDLAVLFDEDTQCRIVERLRPEFCIVPCIRAGRRGGAEA